MNYLRPVLRGPENRGFLGGDDHVRVAGNGYEWIREKLPTIPNWDY